MEKGNHKEARKVVFVILFCLTTFAFCGCSRISDYSTDSLYPEGVGSVFLEIFDNASFRRGVEYELSEALSKRIEAETGYKVTSSRDRADTVISGKIVSVLGSAPTVERETGRALEKEVELQAIVNWKNLKTGKLLIDNAVVNASASYSEWQMQGFRYGSALAANKLAQRIVELMEKEW
jgi:hypothetical protein